ncbi:MAG: PKD domain-containing protein [Bacteroidetes bacterium]|nr:PKD domain-containing protein [Bacteroidota bacterium]MBL6944226.1 PKD domain-containing protein [Bacteroidales bacterium]
MKHFTLLLSFLIIIVSGTCLKSFAQISIKSIPISYNVSLTTEIPTIEIPNIIPKTTLIEEKAPVQAGYTLPFDYELSLNGNWENADNLFVWRLEVFIPEAEAINLYFNNIGLQIGEKIFLYNPHKKNTLGAFTNKNNGLFMCTDFVSGDRVIIEFNTNKRYKNLPFSIHEAGVLIANDMREANGFGDAGSCEVHVNCIEGENWQNEKGGVARILVKQSDLTFWCTGSLINNTKNDGTPYFLTANHCGDWSDSADYAQWLFYFNFESENCEQPLFEPELNTLSGASLIARAPNGTFHGSDFKLLRLNNNVPVNYKPYYNGWDRTGLASPMGVTIHHPEGDLKMISTYTTPLISTYYNNPNEDPAGKYWMVHWTETVSGHGVTEGGSSGSPIFSKEGYVVGALTGGSASCTFLNDPDYYGKFSYSWDSIGQDSIMQLKCWLDPIESGVTKLEGTNLDSINIFAGFSGEQTSIIVGESVSFINTSFGNISGYSWYFEGGTPENVESKEPGSIKYYNVGEYDVRLIVSATDKVDTLVRNDYIKVLPNISPNPSDGKVKISFGEWITDDIDYILDNTRIFNSIGKEVGFRKLADGDNYAIIEIIPTKQGLYFIKISTANINNTYRVVVVGY